MPQFSPEKFIDFVENYDKNNSNQRSALVDFAKEVAKEQPELLADEAQWVMKYRTKVAAVQSSVPPKNQSTLEVPYYSQRDNYRDASRTCFSSSCAMLCKFLKPSSINSDDDYVREVFKRGDSTDSSVQVRTLAHYGINARFATNMKFSDLDGLLTRGIPVPIGILHKGPASAPSGGGHWIIVIGKVADAKAPGGCWYIVHDPWGEINNSDGTYSSTNGKELRYSKGMLGRRWTVEGDGSGWGIIASK